MEDLYALLPEGVVREEGPPVAPPCDWDDGYVLPQHSEKPLQKLHRHSNDTRLVFYEQPHVYTFDNVPTSASVTALAHDYEKPFDPVAAIASMKTSRSQAWPRLEYVVDAQPFASPDVSRGVLAVCNGKTISVVQPHCFISSASVEDFRKVLEVCTIKGACYDEEQCELYSFSREKTDDEIRNEWTRKGQRASHMGTEGHWLCECFLNGVPCRWWEPEMKILFGFAREHLLPRGIVAWNTEKEIVCKRADLAGSIDAIFYEPSTNMYHIVDFKRSDKLKAQLRGYGKMTGALSHLDDCKGAAYALQTSIYQWILEEEYGMTIGDRILLSIHPDQPFYTSVPYLKAEVEFIMRKRIALVDARRTVAASDARFQCALTGAPVFDAVTLEDGRVAMEKAALVQELTYTVNEELRNEFEREVFHQQQKETQVEIESKLCMSWRKRMPEKGLVPFQ